MIKDGVILSCKYIKCRYNKDRNCNMEYVELDWDGICTYSEEV